MTLETISALSAVAGRYGVLYCDIWGVVHDGAKAHPAACAALAAARAQGVTVVLVTNSPRLRDGVAAQIAQLGVPEAAYDAIVTSGDVTRALIADGPREVYHLGPERDLGLFAGLDVERVGVEAARAVVCTGLFDDEAETPDDYAQMLGTFHARGLPLICANPDLRVGRGGRLVYCAGAIAESYERLGGAVLVAGKPHRPIYERARALAAQARGQAVGDLGKGLGIGDGLWTDIKGAIANGLDALYVSGGVDRDIGDPGAQLKRLVSDLGTGHAPRLLTMAELA